MGVAQQYLGVAQQYMGVAQQYMGVAQQCMGVAQQCRGVAQQYTCRCTTWQNADENSDEWKSRAMEWQRAPFVPFFCKLIQMPKEIQLSFSPRNACVADWQRWKFNT